MTHLFLIIILLLSIYILLVPVIVSLKVDSTFSPELKIKFYPFTFRIVKTARNGSKTRGQIDFARLFFAEYQTANRILVDLWKFIKALFKSKHHHLTITLRGGFGAPDFTGCVCGMIEAIKPAFGNRVTIVYYPDMVSEALNCDLHTHAVVRMYRVFAETLILILRLPSVKIVKIFIKIRKGDYNARPA